MGDIERDAVSVVRQRFPARGDARARSAFERRGRGLAVVDRAGAIVATDSAFRRLAGIRRGAPAGELTCCTVLGCDLPGNAGLGGCVTEQLLRSGQAVDIDVALELPARRGTVRLSGAPLEGALELAVLELRAPAAPAATVIRVRALGRMQVETGEGVISGDWLDQRPGQLLKYLVAERRRVVSVEDIAEALWPAADFTTVNTVRHLVHVLRRRLEPPRRHPAQGGAAACIVSRRGGYALDEASVTVDADEFTAAAEHALAFGAGDGDATAALEQALALYRGDFVADEPYAGWAEPERERLRALVERVLQALADVARERGDMATEATYVERLAAFEPFDSGPHRELILLSLRAGHRGRALRQYEAFDARMQRAFGERPDFTFEELMRATRA
jgi:DNA-binding SARP family transcriptional activator